MSDGSILEPRGRRFGSVADPSGPFSARASVPEWTANTTMGVRGKMYRQSEARGAVVRDGARALKAHGATDPTGPLYPIQGPDPRSGLAPSFVSLGADNCGVAA